MSLNELTLASAIKKLKAKEISHKELYASFDSIVEEKNKSLNAYLSLNKKAESQAAALLDLPLAGAPIAVKDNFCTKGIITTASSNVLENFVPQFDSTVTKNLKQNGGVVYGKTNLDAWAHGSSTETSSFGRTLNPRNTAHLPGGSSGGSAASVAADLCLASIGSETAGSIRQPAAWCGTVGLKPTYGRCSRQGVVSMASSTDSPGTIAKTVEDAALLLNHIAGYDPYDGTSNNESVPDFTATLNKPIKGLKVGVLYLDVEGLEEIKPLYEKQLQVLTDLGAEVEMVSALDPHYAISVYTIVQRGEVSSNLARYDGVRYGTDRSFFGDEAKRRIMLGTYTLSKGYADQYYNLAQKVRALFIEDFTALFNTYDVLISPTSPGFAKKIGATEGEAMFGELEDMLLEPSSIAGLPGISVPCFRDPETNLYLGLNIMAPMWQEQRCIQVGAAFEAATTWNSWRNK
jgi:aspartyl-tRNA(Asn)/glutamyl-tRNA(Gln) amidotransferase subunit A